VLLGPQYAVVSVVVAVAVVVVVVVVDVVVVVVVVVVVIFYRIMIIGRSTLLSYGISNSTCLL
jgi:hypothetical protein